MLKAPYAIQCCYVILNFLRNRGTVKALSCVCPLGLACLGYDPERTLLEHTSLCITCALQALLVTTGPATLRRGICKGLFLLTDRVSAGHPDVEGLVMDTQSLLTDIVQRSRVVRKCTDLHIHITGVSPAMFQKMLACNPREASQAAAGQILSAQRTE